MLRTARTHRKPPSAWLTGNRGPWKERDYLLTLAYEKWEEGLCSCGQPAVIAHHPDNDGEYDIERVQCHACAALDQANKGREPEPGEKSWAQYTRPTWKPLPAWPA